MSLLQPSGQLSDSALNALFETIASQLESQGYVVLENALPDIVGQDLLHSWQHLHEHDLHFASIGRGVLQQKNSRVRSDRIFWLDDNHPHYNRHWLSFTQQLKEYLNRHLFLGLFSFESHLAVYRQGDFYKKHFDAFKGNQNRVLSLVSYLNPCWQPGDGGELLLYSDVDNDQVVCQIEPKFATMVLFLSEDFPHEVLPSHNLRLSVAGWFRVNGSGLAKLDPPK